MGCWRLSCLSYRAHFLADVCCGGGLRSQGTRSQTETPRLSKASFSASLTQRRPHVTPRLYNMPFMAFVNLNRDALLRYGKPRWNLCDHSRMTHTSLLGPLVVTRRLVNCGPAFSRPVRFRTGRRAAKRRQHAGRRETRAGGSKDIFDKIGDVNDCNDSLMKHSCNSNSKVDRFSAKDRKCVLSVAAPARKRNFLGPHVYPPERIC